MIIKPNPDGGKIISYTPEKDTPLIEENHILLLTVKRTKTKDNLGVLAPHIKEGQDVRVDIRTIRNMRFTDTNGNTFDKLIISLVNESGNVIMANDNTGSWIFAECLFL